MNPVWSLLLGLAVVTGITVLTAFFVAQEFAYMAVDRARLASRARRGDRSAERALSITARTSFLLSGAQLGITITGLLVGYVAEPLIGVALADLVGWPSRAAAMVLGAIIALLVSTVVQMLCGELFPKNYAIARAEEVAIWLATPTMVYLRVLGPLIWVFDRSAEALLRVLRIEPVHDVEHAATPQDLVHVIDSSRDSGDLPEELSTMLDRILDFPSRDIEHAVVPRRLVDTLPADATVAHARQLMATGHTRYPVLSRREEIAGVAHLIDLLPSDVAGTDPIVHHLRPALVLSAYMPLPDALGALRAAREDMACVVDEFGGFEGIITVEDIAEEVVGEIDDEHDARPTESPVVDGAWTLPGNTPLDEIERTLRIELPRGDYETVSGLILEMLGDLPTAGQVLEIPLALKTTPQPQEQQVLRVQVGEIVSHVPSEVTLRLIGSDA